MTTSKTNRKAAIAAAIADAELATATFREACKAMDAATQQYEKDFTDSINVAIGSAREIGASIVSKARRDIDDLPADLGWITQPVSLRAHLVSPWDAYREGFTYWWNGQVYLVKERFMYGSERDVATAIRQSLQRHDEVAAIRVQCEVLCADPDESWSSENERLRERVSTTTSIIPTTNPHRPSH